MKLFKKWKSLTKKWKSNKEKNQEMPTNPKALSKCKSWPPWFSPRASTSSSTTKQQVAPVGCFSVYVGFERQRFVIKAKYANHPLFKMLLEDAEQQYGYSKEGPLLLPCDVDMFYKVLAEMDSDNTDVIRTRGCGSYGSYTLLSPSRLLKMNQF